jgi:hypothetical protein
MGITVALWQEKQEQGKRRWMKESKFLEMKENEWRQHKNKIKWKRDRYKSRLVWSGPVCCGLVMACDPVRRTYIFSAETCLCLAGHSTASA